jgi:uncharacterized protein YjiS (DUF1127 family)
VPCVTPPHCRMRVGSLVIGIDAAMSILNMSATFFRARSGLWRWSEVKRYLVECVRRVRFRYELIALSERDLADMGMTRLDAFNESIKPFWEE